MSKLPSRSWAPPSFVRLEGIIRTSHPASFSITHSYCNMNTYISQLKNEEIGIPFHTIYGFYLMHYKRINMVKKFSEKIHFRCSIEKYVYINLCSR